MKHLYFLCVVFVFLFAGYALSQGSNKEHNLTPVDYVNPYMGNISHLLVPTYPTIHLPNSMLRVYPERSDYTGSQLHGLPLIITSHRGTSAFNLSPCQGEPLQPVVNYSYDHENVKPYYYEVFLDEEQIEVKYAPSRQSALYQLRFTQTDKPAYLIVNSRHGKVQVAENHISGYQHLDNNTRVYLYLETEQMPVQSDMLVDGKLSRTTTAEGHNACAVLAFAKQTEYVRVRYGISFISEEQARKNMERELSGYDVVALADKGRNIWNASLGKIDVKGGDTDSKRVFILLCTGYLNAQSVSAKTGAISARSIIGYIMIMVCLSIQMIGYGTHIVQPIHYVYLSIKIRSWTSFGPICVWQNRWERCGCLLSRKLQEILDE